MTAENPYVPRAARIGWMRDETRDVRTLGLQLENGNGAEDFRWKPGQFAMYSVFGAGECAFTLANSPTRSEANGHGTEVQCTFRTVGKVTHALWSLQQGQTIGIRGPYGNTFDVEGWEGRHVAFIGGGIGMAALRAPLQHVLDHRDRYGDVTVLNGARTAEDLVYRTEAEEWAAARVDLVRTVDPGGETPEWDGRVGMLPDVFRELELGPQDRVVVACGPPVMLHFLFQALDEMGFEPHQVVTTLENKMKCAIGHCGRCNVGDTYLCTEGPVFSRDQLERLPDDL